MPTANPTAAVTPQVRSLHALLNQISAPPPEDDRYGAQQGVNFGQDSAPHPARIFCSSTPPRHLAPPTVCSRRVGRYLAGHCLSRTRTGAPSRRAARSGRLITRC